MSRAKWFPSLVLAALFVSALPALAQKEAAAPTPGKNVQITLTISKTGGSGPPQKVFKFIGQDRASARMLVGWRTPIPTISSAREDSGKPPVTTYTYQNVGVSAEIKVNLLGQGSISLQGQIEISAVREGPPVGAGGEKAPLIGTFQQVLNVIVMEGKKLRVAEGPDPDGSTVSLDIQADVLP